LDGKKNTLKYGTKNRKGYITTPYIFLKGVS
jgi:glutaredoxin